MRRTLGTAVVTVSVLSFGATSCGGDDDATRDCADIGADGRATDDVKSDFLEALCTSPEGIEAKARVNGYQCLDGPAIVHNSYGWGYEGDTWHEFDEGQTEPPQSDVERCLNVIMPD